MIMFEINVTESCPFTCHNCISSIHKPPKEKMFTLLDKLHDRGIHDFWLWLTGGEPFLALEKLNRYLSYQEKSSIVTTGLVNASIIPDLLEAHKELRMNITVLGSKEYESSFRQSKMNITDDDYSRNYLRRVKDKHRINIVCVLYKDSIASGDVYTNVKYIADTFSDFNITLMWDRFEIFDHEDIKGVYDFVEFLKKNNRSLVMNAMPIRAMSPSIFVNGDRLKVSSSNSFHTFDIEDCINDINGFFHTVATGFNLHSKDAMIKCPVYKLYPGCGGPDCRYGHKEDCENYWGQFIL